MSPDDEGVVDDLYGALRDARFASDLKNAKKRLAQIKAILDGYREADIFPQLSRWHYESGFLLNIEGQYEASISEFETSRDFAREAGRETGEIIGEFRRFLTRFNAGLVAPEQFYEELIKVRQRYQEIQRVSNEDAFLRTANGYSIAKRIMEVTFEMNSPEFTYWAQKLLDHELMRSGLHQENISDLLLNVQVLARIELFNGNPKAAACIYATYLEAKLPDFVPDSRIQQTEKISAYAHTGAEETVRDYRDFGRALSLCDAKHSRQLAKDAWQRGLQIPAGRGNLRFLNDIRRELGLS
ncbi:MAG: hypothetical protein AAF530_24125 [Pseudomonadota bacterium]